MRSDDAVETIKRHAHDEEGAAESSSKQHCHYESTVIILTGVEIHICDLVKVSTECCNAMNVKYMFSF